MQQLDVLRQQWELFSCQNQCSDKAFHFVESANVEFFEPCGFLACKSHRQCCESISGNGVATLLSVLLIFV